MGIEDPTSPLLFPLPAYSILWVLGSRLERVSPWKRCLLSAGFFGRAERTPRGFVPLFGNNSSWMRGGAAFLLRLGVPQGCKAAPTSSLRPTFVMHPRTYVGRSHGPAASFNT